MKNEVKIDKRRVGRPRKFDSRMSLSVRVTQRMYDVLTERRKESGRSLSEEIEMILEKAFFPMDPELAASIRKMPEKVPQKPKPPIRGYHA